MQLHSAGVEGSEDAGAHSKLPQPSQEDSWSHFNNMQNLRLKGILHLKMIIFNESFFTHPHVIPNP